MTRNPGAAGRTAALLAALLCAGPPPLPAAAAARPARVAVTPPRRPDSALFLEAQQAEVALKASPRLAGRTAEWEGVVLRYRRLVARYPKSGYSDNALLAIGNLYREMGTRFHTARYDDDAVKAYRALVSEYPRSRLGDDALWAVVQMAQVANDRKRIAEAGKAYLDAFPDAPRAGEVKALLRRKTPSAPLPSPPPPGLVQVTDLRAWSGDSSTRVVVDLDKKVKLLYDRIADPDRLFVDLVGTRLHPNLKNRSFPVGDGLLEKIRLAQNKDDVVRVVLDFKDVKDHSIFFLEDPTRLVIDVRGAARAGTRVAEKAEPTPGSVDALPSHRLDGMVASPPASRQTPGAKAAPIVIGSAEGPGPTSSAPPREASGRDRSRRAPPAPEPPDLNRAGSYSLARQLGLGARRIVIDAGHGGHDPGTIGAGGLQEKDLVLDVSLRLEKLVRAELGAEVLMTRSSDAYVPLEERTAIANSRAADLFLSVHANASRDRRARGIETYFGGRPGERDLRRHPQGPAAAREGHHPEQQDRREPGLRGVGAGSHGPEHPRAAPGGGPGSAHGALLRPHRGQHAERSRGDRLREQPRGREAPQDARVPRRHCPGPLPRRPGLSGGPEPHPDAAIDGLRKPFYSGREGPRPMNPADHAITWIKVERPTFDLVGVIMSSFELTGLLLVFAVLVGLLLGLSLILRRRRTGLPAIDAISLRLN